MDLNATEKRDAILEEALDVAPEQLESFLDFGAGPRTRSLKTRSDDCWAHARV